MQFWQLRPIAPASQHLIGSSEMPERLTASTNHSPTACLRGIYEAGHILLRRWTEKLLLAAPELPEILHRQRYKLFQNH